MSQLSQVIIIDSLTFPSQDAVHHRGGIRGWTYLSLTCPPRPSFPTLQSWADEIGVVWKEIVA